MKRILFLLVLVLTVSAGWAKNDKKQGGIVLGDPAFKAYTDSLTRLGDLHFFKTGEFDKALKYYVEAYKKGGIDAGFMLGRCLAEGLGTEIDMSQAIELWSQAASAGSADAAQKIGECYFLGIGLKKDKQSAFQWYNKAHELGSSEATYLLGTFYYNGEGVEKDVDKAIELWTKAADAGNARAQETLGIFYFEGTEVHRNMLFAVKYLKMAADQGRAKAAFYAGLCCEKSYGLSMEDYVSAAYYYMVAADAEIPEAQARLANLYIEGKGVEKNIDRANYWLKQAQLNGLVLSEE